MAPNKFTQKYMFDRRALKGSDSARNHLVPIDVDEVTSIKLKCAWICKKSIYMANDAFRTKYGTSLPFRPLKV